jgi:hypothetical protein
MMDDSKGRCQHEKIVEPCRHGSRRAASSERRFDEWMTFDWLSARKN